MENKKKEAKLVFNAGVARKLIKAGCQVVDIKQSRENADKTIFAFKNDEHFRVEFEKINKELAEAKAAEESKAE